MEKNSLTWLLFNGHRNIPENFNTFLLTPETDYVVSAYVSGNSLVL